MCKHICSQMNVAIAAVIAGVLGTRFRINDCIDAVNIEMQAHAVQILRFQNKERGCVKINRVDSARQMMD